MLTFTWAPSVFSSARASPPPARRRAASTAGPTPLSTRRPQSDVDAQRGGEEPAQRALDDVVPEPVVTESGSKGRRVGQRLGHRRKDQRGERGQPLVERGEPPGLGRVAGRPGERGRGGRGIRGV